MKITLEIPDDLMRRVELHALETNRGVGITVIALLESGLNGASVKAKPEPIRLPKPIKLKKPYSIDEIEQAINDGRS